MSSSKGLLSAWVKAQTLMTSCCVRLGHVLDTYNLRTRSRHILPVSLEGKHIKRVPTLGRRPTNQDTRALYYDISHVYFINTFNNVKVHKN